MTPDEAIEIVKSKSRGRTRYEGQQPWIDEVLVDEIKKLRRQRADLAGALRDMDTKTDIAQDVDWEAEWTPMIDRVRSILYEVEPEIAAEKGQSE